MDLGVEDREPQAVGGEGYGLKPGIRALPDPRPAGRSRPDGSVLGGRAADRPSPAAPVPVTPKVWPALQRHWPMKPRRCGRRHRAALSPRRRLQHAGLTMETLTDTRVLAALRRPDPADGGRPPRVDRSRAGRGRRGSTGMATAELAHRRDAADRARGGPGAQALVPGGLRRRGRGHCVERWSGPPGDSAIAINRTDVLAIAAILAGLAWTFRRTRGPVAATRWTRLVRTGGYAAVLALVLAKSAVERVADAPPNNAAGGPAVAWAGEMVFLAVMAGVRGADPGIHGATLPGTPGHLDHRHLGRPGPRRRGLPARTARLPTPLHRSMAGSPIRRGARLRSAAGPVRSGGGGIGGRAASRRRNACWFPLPAGRHGRIVVGDSRRTRSRRPVDRHHRDPAL